MRAAFADFAADGRFVRQWGPDSGHQPQLETADGPEGFDPPFGSGLVLERLDLPGCDVPVWAPSLEAYRSGVLGLAAGLIRAGAVPGMEACDGA